MKRRNFLKKSSLAAIGSTSLANTLLNLKMMSNAVAAPVENDYRALVCVFLAGGNDSYNMLVPTTTSASDGASSAEKEAQSVEYTNYKKIRGNLALPYPDNGAGHLLEQDELLKLILTQSSNRSFGLHGAMPKLKNRVDDGNATFIANLGSLVERVDIASVRSGAASAAGKLPRALFSHNDQQMTWQTSLARSRSNTGWGGRIADRLLTTNTSNDVSMNISLVGNQSFLVGNDAISYSIGKDGARILDGSGSSDIFDMERVAAAKSIVSGADQHLLMRAFAREKQLAFESSEAFSSAFNNVNITSSFGGHSFGDELKAVARTIGSSRDLGLKRQIFFVQLGGFDHHAELPASHRRLLGILDDALAGFWDALGELNARDNVVTFTCSDFGRTLRSNGAGTDHAWGGNSIVMGGPVKQKLVADGINNGSRIYGDYPDASELRVNDGLDFGSNGRMLPTTSIDEYFGELSLWLGLPKSQLVDVLPNIGNFYSTSSSDGPLGFLPT